MELLQPNIYRWRHMSVGTFSSFLDKKSKLLTQKQFLESFHFDWIFTKLGSTPFYQFFFGFPSLFLWLKVYFCFFFSQALFLKTYPSSNLPLSQFCIVEDLQRYSTKLSRMWWLVDSCNPPKVFRLRYVMSLFIMSFSNKILQYKLKPKSKNMFCWWIWCFLTNIDWRSC